jgi:hypothetical protein
MGRMARTNIVEEKARRVIRLFREPCLRLAHPASAQQVLKPYREIRPIHGGPAYTEEMITTVRLEDGGLSVQIPRRHFSHSRDLYAL